MSEVETTGQDGQPEVRRRQAILDFDRPNLYPKQEEAIFDPKRISIIEASTKSGKTAGCIAWLTELAMSGKPGENFWWVAPVTPQCDIAFNRMMRGLPRQIITGYFSNPKKIIFHHVDTTIWFKSGDHEDTLYGEDVHACVIDEASRLKAGAWYAIRTTLTATRGRLRIIGNVKGKKNWFYQLARRAEAGHPEMGYHRLTAYDAIQARVLAAEEIESARDSGMPEHVWRELYLAEASEDSGNPFGERAIDACVAPLSSDEPYCWGWDLAKSRDFTVGIALDRKGRCCRFLRFQKPWAETVETILQETGKTPMFVDQTGVGDPIVESLQRRLRQTDPKTASVQGYKFTAPSKQMLMEGLALAINAGEISFPEGPIVLELKQFEYVYKPSGVHYAAMEGANDDGLESAFLVTGLKATARERRVVRRMRVRSSKKPSFLLRTQIILTVVWRSGLGHRFALAIPARLGHPERFPWPDPA
jgi:hypothetical protein